MKTQSSNLPFLKDSFFYTNIINRSFWNRVKHYEKWNPELIPFYEWEGILYVGCLKPDPTIKNKNIVFILVSIKNLNMLWKTCEQLSLPPSDIHNNNINTDSIKIKKKSNILSKPYTILNTILKTNILSQLMPHSADNIYTKCFKFAETYFTGVVVFSFKSETFKPIEWNELMAGPVLPIDTKQPSVFKIIHQSKKPYHGPLNENNKIHKDFFTVRGFDKLPKYLTLIPIFDKSQNIIGAFMGITDEYIAGSKFDVIVKWTQMLSTALSDQDKQEKQQAQVA